MATRPSRSKVDIDAVYAFASELRAGGRALESLTHFRAALGRAPGRWDIWADYGNALADLDRIDAALAAYAKSLALRPDVPAVLQNRGITFLQANDLDHARADFERALALAPESAALRFDLALTRLLGGDLAGGFELYEARFEDPRLGTPARRPGRPRWYGEEPVAGRRILLHAEQGLGDTLQFARYVPLVAERGAQVILEVPPLLVPLLRGLPGAGTVIARGSELPPFDLHCPLASLPRAFGTTLETIPATVPYLAADRVAVEDWRTWLPPGRPRVGIAWAGNRRHRNDARRSLPLELLEPLARGSWQLVALQKDLSLAESRVLANWEAADASPRLTDFAATAGAVLAVDIVVSVDTALAHLAGALGRPVWLLLPHAPDWRWLLGRDDSPWYPTARLFRQPRTGDWATPLAHVHRELCARFG